MTKLIKIKELLITNSSFLFNQRFFEGEAFGLNPYVLKFKTKQYREIKDFLDDFLVFLEKKQINPRFPYPIYIKTQAVLYKNSFIVIKNDSELPPYFPTKAIRHTSRELSYFQKINILTKKINNQNVSEGIRYLMKNSSKRKELYNLCHENDFYERLTNSLTE